MKRIALFAAVGAAALFSLPALAGGFTLTSPGIHAGRTIAKTYVYQGSGCTGRNVSPALHWSGAPKGTKSFVVTVYDPDAPTGAGWWHWLVANIPADVHGLPRGAGDPGGKGMPGSAVQLRNDYGDNAYGGPCPPRGDTPHHYQFKVYALDVPSLPVNATTPADQLGFMVHMHTLGVAELVGRYGRK